jgi:predicted dehydrogenase
MVRATNRGTYPGGWFGDPALAGGGALMDHIVHVADLLRWIWGSEFRSVYAEAATRYYDLPVDDCGIVLITLENGVVVSLDPSWSRPAQSFPTWGDVTMEVTGTQGISAIDVFAQNVELFSNRHIRARLVAWGDDFDRLMISDWLAALRAGNPPPITGEDGLRAVELVQSAYQSARTHQPVAVQRA